MRFQRALVAFTVIALLAASVGTADAKKRRKKKGGTTPSVVVIESASGTHITGTVESKKAPCIDGRKVTLTRNGSPIAAGEADSEGQWFSRTGGTMANGDVIIAKLDEIKVKSGKKRITCGSDSDRMVVNPNTGSGDTTPPGAPDGGPGTGGARTLLVNVTNAAGNVDSSPPGIQDCEDESCSANFATGTTVVLTGQPNANHHAEFTGCDATSGNQCSVTMNVNRTVEVTFVCNGTDPVNLLACTVADALQ